MESPLLPEPRNYSATGVSSREQVCAIVSPSLCLLIDTGRPPYTPKATANGGFGRIADES